MNKIIKKLSLGVFLASSVSLSPLANADTADGASLMNKSWDQIVETAKGGEVNWFLWGGADHINQYVTEYVGGVLKDQYDITLNRVPLTDTAAAVNTVLSEKESGVNDKGTVDMIWINGENFKTMKQGDMAWCGYLDKLPNNKLVNWNNQAIANDFGVPVDGCESPWNRAHSVFAYDTATMAKPPMSIGELIEWIKANPGMFTYPAPPDFTGSAFVRHVFYYAAGGAENLLGPFDQAKYDAAASKAWKILNDLEPFLWREGKTYPANPSALTQLFANTEIAIYFNYNPANIAKEVTNGVFPETVRTYRMDDGNIGNTNYTIIPYNSPNKAAALVLQNVLLSGEAQLEKAKPEVWGTNPGIEMDRTASAILAAFNAIEKHPAAIPMDNTDGALPELQGGWIKAIEKGWIENVGTN
ncbi:MAG: ABC transporter substrate-binding protein [Candidatus Puniceispirillales bacterium]|jgi:putative spermidine/putrescine transport system substrate-binding protein|tara:strand:+ start:1286 stop:2527 length:1242 start_codon:yes stop_codon:yes gene_type:complete